MKSSGGQAARSARRAAEHDRHDRHGLPSAAWLERGAFFILLLIVGMRPLLSETYESGEGLFGDYVRTAVIATPATTAGFDVAIWLAAIAATIAVILRRKTAAAAFRWTGLEIGWLVMVLAAAVSTVAVASNKRLALNASVDWLTAGALAMTLARLCRDRLRVALLLGVIVAAGAASATKSVMQVASEYRATRDDYEQNKENLWRGVPPDDPRRQMYERRLKASEATGFLAYPNAEGSLLMLSAFAAVAAGGLAGLRWMRWAMYGGAAAMLAAILLTGSKGAVLAAGAGAGLLLLLHHLRGSLRHRWRVALIACWAAVLLAAAGVVGFGLVRGSLPTASLAFRWDYWRVTTRIIGQHPFFGVGALNFDRAYLPLKPIEFPEEIRDPHNFVLSVAAQWGLVGLAGLVAAVVGASIMIARRWAHPTEADNQPAAPLKEADRTARKRWIISVIVGFVLLRSWLLWGMTGTEGGRAVLFIDLVQYISVWAAAFAGVVAASINRGRQGGWNWRLVALCGAAAFLLHNTIDFALFVPSAGTVFAALIGLLLADSEQARADVAVQDSALVGAGRKTPVWWLFAMPAVAVVGLLITVIWVYQPVAGAMEALELARRVPLESAQAHYVAAAAADPYDPVPLSELAERIANEPNPQRVDAALQALDQAIQRDPLQMSLYRWRMQFYDLRYRISGAASDLRAAIAAARHVLELYPLSPEEHLNLATVLAHAAAATGSPAWAEEARAEYARALELDYIRPGLDEVRKWSKSRRAEVEAAMKRIVVSPGSAPAG